MDNSIYVALSRQKAVFRDMNVTANNLANANTPGYHTEQMMFTDYLTKQGSVMDPKLSFTQDISSWRDTTNGGLNQTGNPLDMAITGPGFFVIEGPNGPRYTRAGGFTMGNDGTLMTATGFPVLDDGGQRIAFDETVRKISIGSNGVISITNNEGALEERGNIGLVEFEDPQRLKRVGNTMYETDQAALPATVSQVTQGALESSNVSPVQELVKVTKLARATSSTAKFIETMYDLTRKTSNAYARASNQ